MPRACCFPFLLTTSLLIGLGCSSARLVRDVSQIEKPAISALANHQEESGRETIAQLMQTTIRSPELSRRFNLEVYHRNDTTAFYTGGFLGMGSFKGLISGVRLIVVLPDQKQYYDGILAGLTEPDLSRYEYIATRIRAILEGKLSCDEAHDTYADRYELWDQNFYLKGGRIVKTVFTSLVDSITIEVGLFKFRDDFPYYEIKQVRLINRENGANIKLSMIEQHYGPVPDMKFRLPDTADWDRIDHLELK